MDSRRFRAERSGSGQSVSLGLTDLMTSLAVIFVLLLVVFANAARSADARARATEASAVAAGGASGVEQARASIQNAMQHGLALETDPLDPHVLRVVIPERFLNFEFGKAALTPSADRFLTEVMPAFAAAVCGPVRESIAGIVIEGHTDDLGGEALNLRLSQERSFQVLVRGLEAIRASAPSAHGCFGELASASGRGKQDLLYDDEQKPDRDLSRRVLFKILLRPGMSLPERPAARAAAAPAPVTGTPAPVTDSRAAATR